MIKLQKQSSSIDIFTALMVAFAFFCYADDLEAKDSTGVREYEFPEVEVNADKVQISPISKYSSSYFINNLQLKNIGALQIDEVLAKSPGVFIKNYGGAGGMKSMSIRGTNASQNLIMIDGIALNSSQNAMYDLSLFPTSFVNSMEVIRGGTSDVYGANAVGGVVNFITENDPDKDKYSASISAGSYGEYKANAEYSTKFYGLFTHIGAEYLDSKGNYKFKFNQNGKNVNLRRDNADFENIALNLILGGELKDLKINFKSIMNSAKRGVPGAVVQNRIESLYAKLDEDNILNILSVAKETKKSGTFKLSAVAKFSQQKYSDDAPNAFNSLSNSLFINKELRGIANYIFAQNTYSIRINSEYNYAELTGDMLDQSVGDFVKRINYSVNANIDKQLRLSESFSLSLSPSARLDVFSDNSPVISSGLGCVLNYEPYELETKIRISKNFRMPSFNELYYYNYGTSNLKPESSNSLTLSLAKSLLGLLKIELSGFYINTKNQIISVPKNTISWSAQNLGRAETYGIELASAGNLYFDNLVFNVSYTLQRSLDKSDNSMTYGKQIVYVPHEIMNGGLNYFLLSWNFKIDVDYVSHRFSMPDNSYNSMLPRYLLLNFGAGYTLNIFGVNSKISFDMKNLFDKQYSVIQNYPMPGRTFRLTLSIDN